MPSFFHDDWFLCDGLSKCPAGSQIIEIRDYSVAGVPAGDSFLRISGVFPPSTVSAVVGYGSFSDHGSSDPFRYTIYFNIQANGETTHYFGKVFSHTPSTMETILTGKKRIVLADGTIKSLAIDDWTANRPTA